jgi:hypothetical protein
MSAVLAPASTSRRHLRQHWYFCTRKKVLFYQYASTFVAVKEVYQPACSSRFWIAARSSVTRCAYWCVRVRESRRSCSAACIRPHPSASVSIRQHTSAYVSIRQHTTASVRIRPHPSASVSIRQHTTASVRIRQHTSAYVSIR